MKQLILMNDHNVFTMYNVYSEAGQQQRGRVQWYVTKFGGRCHFWTQHIQSESYMPHHPAAVWALRTPLAAALYIFPKRWWECELLLPHFPFPPCLGPPLGECCMFTPRMTQMVCALYNMTTALNMNTALLCLLTTHRSRCCNRMSGRCSVWTVILCSNE